MMLEHVVEISADVIGAIAAAILVAPPLMSAKARDRVASWRQRLAIADSATRQRVVPYVEMHTGIEGSPSERNWLRFGLILVLFSFGLKLWYHLLSKHLFGF